MVVPDTVGRPDTVVEGDGVPVAVLVPVAELVLDDVAVSAAVPVPDTLEV